MAYNTQQKAFQEHLFRSLHYYLLEWDINTDDALTVWDGMRTALAIQFAKKKPEDEKKDDAE